MSKLTKVFLFAREDVNDPEDEFSYDVDCALDEAIASSSEEFIDFIQTGLFGQEEDEVCFLIEDTNHRIIDCGLGAKFALQTEMDNSYVNHFI